MNETIREYLKRRQPWFVAAFCACLALMLVPVIPASLMLLGHRNEYGLRHYAGFTVIIGACLLSMARLTCPKCNKPLSLRGGWPTVPACCPHCGVNFDTPMPQSPISPIS
jgi:hypothetical protein